MPPTPTSTRWSEVERAPAPSHGQIRESRGTRAQPGSGRRRQQTAKPARTKIGIRPRARILQDALCDNPRLACHRPADEGGVDALRRLLLSTSREVRSGFGRLPAGRTIVARVDRHSGNRERPSHGLLVRPCPYYSMAPRNPCSGAVTPRRTQ